MYEVAESCKRRSYTPLKNTRNTCKISLCWLNETSFPDYGPKRRPPVKRHIVFFPILILWEKIQDGA